MNAKNEVVIRISPDQQRIRVENTNGGVISCKEITEQTFYDCIKQSVRNEEVQSGFLPANCFHVGIENDGSQKQTDSFRSCAVAGGRFRAYRSH